MLTRRKLLKVIIKSIFNDGWRSKEIIGRKSDKISDETMSFESEGIFYHIRLSLTKQQGGDL